MEKVSGRKWWVLMIMVVAFWAGFLLSMQGCASMGLPDDATPEMERAAYCLDAQQAIMVAQITFEDASSNPKRQDEIAKYVLKMQRVLDLYCAGVSQ